VGALERISLVLCELGAGIYIFFSDYWSEYQIDIFLDEVSLNKGFVSFWRGSLYQYS